MGGRAPVQRWRRPKGGRRPCPLGDAEALGTSASEQRVSLLSKRVANSVNRPSSISTLQRFTLQTIRPFDSQKKRCFSVQF